MPKTIVGLDIGRAAVRAVELENADKPRPTIVRAHEVPLPDGAVAAGDVRELQTVASAVRKLWGEGGFKSKDVVLGVGNQRVIARDLTMPKLGTLQQIREALPFQVQEMLPVPVGEALLDFYPISESAGEHGPVVNGMLIAAIKESVLANVKAVQTAGLTALNVDLVPFALVRALARGPIASATVVLVEIGAATTHLVVVADGVPQFVRMIPSGGDDITRALMQRLELSSAQAESLKASRGLGLTPPSSELEHVGAEVIRGVVHELVNGIRNTLQYYVTLRPGQPLQAILLSGGGSQLPGLAQSLGDTMRLQVVAPNVLSTFDVAKSAQKAAGALQSHTVALGLAVGQAA
ncbi:type IV pilus assembly protein PilM [Galbitalea sp. SE-J8]|uniref:type IV pilus assembly protein PilM n=1 Tax=Galbitalea sp. SE-J8 TaxID=3054952 RepID=UPI00259CD0BF|nr:type IV pilus assembly protein PilM [Galbitalea sp. SE-J8]MDM4761517.1 type IV pilus assembly protein PilM [Galbitalea sp. SE-J8]